MWTSTPALRRAVVLSVGLCLLAVTFGRVDLLVMAVPFALGTALTLRSRPAGPAPGRPAPRRRRRRRGR